MEYLYKQEIENIKEINNENIDINKYNSENNKEDNIVKGNDKNNKELFKDLFIEKFEDKTKINKDNKNKTALISSDSDSSCSKNSNNIYSENKYKNVSLINYEFRNIIKKYKKLKELNKNDIELINKDNKKLNKYKDKKEELYVENVIIDTNIIKIRKFLIMIQKK